MHFGRLTDLTGIDLTLPNDAPQNRVLLAGLPPRKGDAKLYIGCPVWADKGYVGKVYPKGTKADQYLYWYCQQFNSIEVNATAYNLPSREGIIKWKQVATPGFKYCPKFPQFISHRRDLDKKDEGIDRFLTLMYELGSHLGPSLLQLPPHFKPNRFAELTRFLEGLPADFEVAVEVRHEDWFSDAKALTDLMDMLQGLGQTIVITDVAGRRDVLHMRLTSPRAFIRFNGHNLHPTDFARIDVWVDRLAEWFGQGLHEAYFFMHEPDKALTADVCGYMIEHVNQKEGLYVKPLTPPDQLKRDLFS